MLEQLWIWLTKPSVSIPVRVDLDDFRDGLRAAIKPSAFKTLFESNLVGLANGNKIDVTIFRPGYRRGFTIRLAAAVTQDRSRNSITGHYYSSVGSKMLWFVTDITIFCMIPVIVAKLMAFDFRGAISVAVFFGCMLIFRVIVLFIILVLVRKDMRDIEAILVDLGQGRGQGSGVRS